MLQPMVITKRIRSSHSFIGNNSYAFSRAESELPPTPKSMFLAHLFSVMGGTPVFVIGSVMTASSVLEWGVPLIAASVAGITTPFVVGSKRRKKYRAELTDALNAFIPQIIFTEVPKLSPGHGAVLDLGYRIDLPLDSGGKFSIKLGREYYMQQRDVAGSIKVIPASNGIAEFDLLLKNLSETEPDVARALHAASRKTEMAQKKVEDQRRKAEPKPTIADFLARNLNRN